VPATYSETKFLIPVATNCTPMHTSSNPMIRFMASSPRYTTIGLNTESTYDWEDSQSTVHLMVSQLLKLGMQPIQWQFGGRYYAENNCKPPLNGVSFARPATGGPSVRPLSNRAAMRRRDRGECFAFHPLSI